MKTKIVRESCERKKCNLIQQIINSIVCMPVKHVFVKNKQICMYIRIYYKMFYCFSFQFKTVHSTIEMSI